MQWQGLLSISHQIDKLHLAVSATSKFALDFFKLRRFDLISTTEMPVEDTAEDDERDANDDQNDSANDEYNVVSAADGASDGTSFQSETIYKNFTLVRVEDETEWFMELFDSHNLDERSSFDGSIS